MPKKYAKKKVYKKPYKKYGTSKRKKFNNQKKKDSGMIIVSPGKSHLVAPEQAYCCFEANCDWRATIQAGAPLVVEWYGNSILHPFDTGPAKAIGSVTGSTIQPGSGASISINPAGFINWMGGSPSTGVYRNFTVMKTVIECEFYPQNLVDTFYAGLCAYNVTASGDVPTNTLQSFMAQPFTVQKIFQATKGPSKLKLVVPWHNFFGVSKEAYKIASQGLDSNEAAGIYTGAFDSGPGNLINVKLIMQDGDYTVSTVPIIVRTKIKYYTRMFNPKRNAMQVV